MEEVTINKDGVGFYEDGHTEVVKDFLDTFYGKTISMTRCEFDNHILKCLGEILGFMNEVHSELGDVKKEVLELQKAVHNMENIKNPENNDVYLINRRIEILANKVELLAAQSTKSKRIKEFFANAFPNTAGH